MTLRNFNWHIFLFLTARDFLSHWTLIRFIEENQSGVRLGQSMAEIIDKNEKIRKKAQRYILIEHVLGCNLHNL